MLNYRRNVSANTVIHGDDGLDFVVADNRLIRIGNIYSERGDKFPLFYACGFFESHDAFDRQRGAGCNPDVVVFRTKAEADSYVTGKVISVRQYVADNVETIDKLIKRFI